MYSYLYIAGMFGLLLVLLGALEARDRPTRAQAIPKLPIPSPLTRGSSKAQIFEWVRFLIVEDMGVLPSRVSVKSDFAHDLFCGEVDVFDLITEIEQMLNLGDLTPNLETVGQLVDYIYDRMNSPLSASNMD